MTLVELKEFMPCPLWHLSWTTLTIQQSCFFFLSLPSFFLLLSLNLFTSSLNDICSNVIERISWSELISVTLPRPEIVSEAQKAQQLDNVVLLFMAENTWLSTNRPWSVVTLAALISVTEKEP